MSSLSYIYILLAVEKSDVIKTLRGMFEKYGPIIDVFVPKAKISGQLSSFAFVTLASSGAAKNAIEEVTGACEADPPRAKTVDGPVTPCKKLKISNVDHGEIN